MRTLYLKPCACLLANQAYEENPNGCEGKVATCWNHAKAGSQMWGLLEGSCKFSEAQSSRVHPCHWSCMQRDQYGGSKAANLSCTLIISCASSAQRTLLKLNKETWWPLGFVICTVLSCSIFFGKVCLKSFKYLNIFGFKWCGDLRVLVVSSRQLNCGDTDCCRDGLGRLGQGRACHLQWFTWSVAFLLGCSEGFDKLCFCSPWVRRVSEWESELFCCWESCREIGVQLWCSAQSFSSEIVQVVSCL